jgi:hypothetical protein
LTSGHPGPDHILVQTEELLDELELDRTELEEDEDELLDEVTTQFAISHLNVIHQFVILFGAKATSQTPNTTNRNFLYIGSVGSNDTEFFLSLIEVTVEFVSPVKAQPLSNINDRNGGAKEEPL